MAKPAKAILRMFEIGFKSVYHEFDEWNCDYVKALDRRTALRWFARRHKIENADLDNPETWRWQVGDWRVSFRYVKEVTMIPCKQCDGTGQIAVGSAR